MRFPLSALAAAASLAAIAPTLPEPAPSPDVRAFIASVTRAYGGLAALNRVHAYRLEGTVYSSMRHVEVGTIRVWSRPDRFKALLDYDPHPEARLASGRDVWRNGPGGPLEPATGPMRGAVLLQAARAGLPWTLLQHAADARVLPGEPPPGPDRIPGDGFHARLVAIEMPLGEGLVLRAWADSLGLIRVSQSLLGSDSTRTDFETYYDDFRESGGVRFAFRELNFASGTQAGYTTVERVIVNPQLRADEFLPSAAADTSGGRRRAR